MSLHHSFPSATLIQRHRSDVQRSIDPFPSALSTTCKTWQQAVRVWDLACQSKTVTLLRSEPRSVSAINRPATEIPPPHPSDGTSTSHTLVSGDGNPLVLAPTSGTSISSIPVPKKLPGVIVISDTESECGSDSDIEATYPEKIRKVYDCYEVTDDEDGGSSLRKIYDAASDTHIDSAAGTNTASKAKAVSFLITANPCDMKLASHAVASGSSHKSLGSASKRRAQKPVRSPPTCLQSSNKFKSEAAHGTEKKRKLRTANEAK